MPIRSNIFAFIGRDTTKRSAKLSKWMEVFINKYGESGLSRLSAANTSLEILRAELLALPFLIEKRLVVFDNVLLEAGEKATEEKKKILAMFASELPKVDNTTFVVFTGSAPDEKNEFFLQLSEIAKIDRIDPLRGNELYGAILAEFPTISTKNARLIVERTKDEAIDTGTILERLRLFSDETLKKDEAIEEILPKNDEYNAFALSDAVLNFQTKQALSLIQQMEGTREIRTEVFIPLVEGIRTALYIAKSRSLGLSDDQIAKNLGVHPFVLSKRPKWNLEKYKIMLSVFDFLIQTEIDSKIGECPWSDDDERLLLGMHRAIFLLEKTEKAATLAK